MKTDRYMHVSENGRKTHPLYEPNKNELQVLDGLYIFLFVPFIELNIFHRDLREDLEIILLFFLKLSSAASPILISETTAF